MEFAAWLNYSNFFLQKQFNAVIEYLNLPSALYHLWTKASQ